MRFYISLPQLLVIGKAMPSFVKGGLIQLRLTYPFPIFFILIFASGGISSGSPPTSSLEAAVTEKVWRARVGTISIYLFDLSLMEMVEAFFVLTVFGKPELGDLCGLCWEVCSFFSWLFFSAVTGTFPPGFVLIFFTGSSSSSSSSYSYSSYSSSTSPPFFLLPSSFRLLLPPPSSFFLLFPPPLSSSSSSSSFDLGRKCISIKGSFMSQVHASNFFITFLSATVLLSIYVYSNILVLLSVLVKEAPFLQWVVVNADISVGKALVLNKNLYHTLHLTWLKECHRERTGRMSCRWRGGP